MKKIKAIFLLSACLLLSFSSCKYQQLLKRGSADEKYEMAVKLYEAKDYSRAMQLFDQLTGAMRATDKAQRIAYFYPYCYYNMRDYTLAAYYFKRYATTYPTSEQAEECMYMSAYCNFMNSPEYSLDQTVTMEALKELQLFTNTYPTSKRVSECNDLIDQLRLKLAFKDFRIARMYYRMEDYSAAITVYNAILKDYPETTHREEILYMVLKSYFRYAEESISDKQKERYTKTLTAYNELASQFPASRFLAEAISFRDRAKTELDAINTGKKNGRVRIQYN